jgi:hypothetical protein
MTARVGAALALVLAVGAALAGCFQPLRCGALGEPCCDIAGVPACIVPEATCNAGTCTGGASCGGVGQVCCPGDVCTAPGATCSGGTCTAGMGCPGTTGECDVSLQNCGPGRACDLTGAATMCIDAGPGVEGSACMVLEDCAAGFYCSSTGQCLRYCCGTCPGTQFCLPTAEGTAAGICTIQCDAVLGTGCPASAGCYGLGVGGMVRELCFGAGSVAFGGGCSFASECQAGLSCVGSICRQLCRPSAPLCPTCTPITGAADLGVCG